MDKVTTAALAQKSAAKKTSKMKKLFNKLYATATALTAMASLTGVQAFAEGEAAPAAGDQFWDSVSLSTAKSGNANNLMGNVIGILLTITRYVGVALVIYGVYEVVMSFMQNQPEAKTKGIVMALAGVVMIGLKGIMQAMNVI